MRPSDSLIQSQREHLPKTWVHESETEHFLSTPNPSHSWARTSPSPPCVVSKVEEQRPSLASASFSFLRRGRAWANKEFSGISCDAHDSQLFCSQSLPCQLYTLPLSPDPSPLPFSPSPLYSLLVQACLPQDLGSLGGVSKGTKEWVFFSPAPPSSGSRS